MVMSKFSQIAVPLLMIWMSLSKLDYWRNMITVLIVVCSCWHCQNKYFLVCVCVFICSIVSIATNMKPSAQPIVAALFQR